MNTPIKNIHVLQIATAFASATPRDASMVLAVRGNCDALAGRSVR